MKAISFLGATTAYDTIYVAASGQKAKAPFFPAAMVHLYPGIDQLRVFVTTEAHNKHYARLEALVRDVVPDVCPVPIPDGRTETELWQIFQAVADAVMPGERLVFDITHGFRSLPFLSFLASAYLRAVKGVTLEAVLYGAFEARDARTDGPAHAPVFDLTRFVTLLDWLTAADRFTRYGDAGELAALLRDPKATPIHMAARTEAAARPMARHLRAAATAIEKVSEPLRLARPVDTMVSAAALTTALSDAEADITALAQPFALIADRVRASYAPFAVSWQAQRADCIESLRVQRELVSWYVARQQHAQAILLAREWVVSYTMALLGHDLFGQRFVAENLLNQGVEARKARVPLPEEIGRPAFSRAIAVWAMLRELRNDLAHCGFRVGALTVDDLVRHATQLPADLATLSLEDLEAATQP